MDKPHSSDKNVPEDQLGKSKSYQLYRALFSSRPKEWEIPKDLSTSIKTFITRSDGALKTSNNYKVDSPLHAQVKNGHNLFEQILNNASANKSKIDRNPKKLGQELASYNQALNALIEINKTAIREYNSKNQYPSSDILTSHTHNAHVETHSSHLEGRFLFSKKGVEILIAEEISVMRAYHHLFNKLGIEIPEGKDEAQVIFETSPADMTHDTHPYLCSVNQQLRMKAEAQAKTMPKNVTKKDIDQKDLNPFQLVFRDAITEVAAYNDWVRGTWNEKYCQWFNLEQDWIKKGMKGVGIEAEDIDKSHKKLLNSAKTREILKGNTTKSANKIAYDWSPKKVVGTWEELVRAKANLKYIHSELSKGFPTESFPASINSRREIEVSGSENNCLLHAFEHASEATSDWDEEKILSTGIEMRKSLTNRMKARLARLELMPQNILTEIGSLVTEEREALPKRISEIEKDAMLELTNYEGRFIIEEVVDRKLIDPSRGLLLFSFEEGRMNCVESDVMPRKPGAVKPPYTFSLQQDVHFNAMI